MTQAANISEVAVTPYAGARDFCRIFAEEMNGLYQLAFLLTADPAKAEQCFVSGNGENRRSGKLLVKEKETLR